MKLIQQKHDFDCNFASLAMWLQIPYEDIQKEAEKLEIWGRGCTTENERKLGKVFAMDLMEVNACFTDCTGILGMPSLNHPLKGHSVFYHDYVFYDPQTDIEGMKSYPADMKDFKPWPYGVSMTIDLNDTDSRDAANWWTMESMKLLGWHTPMGAYRATTRFLEPKHLYDTHVDITHRLSSELEGLRNLIEKEENSS